MERNILRFHVPSLSIPASLRWVTYRLLIIIVGRSQMNLLVPLTLIWVFHLVVWGIIFLYQITISLAVHHWLLCRLSPTTHAASKCFHLGRGWGDLEHHSQHLLLSMGLVQTNKNAWVIFSFSHLALLYLEFYLSFLLLHIFLWH